MFVVGELVRLVCALFLGRDLGVFINNFTVMLMDALWGWAGQSMTLRV